MNSMRAPPGGDNGDPDAPRQLSLLGMSMVLLRQRRLLAAAVFAVFVLVMVTGILAPRTWTSEFSFVPRSSNESVSRLGGIAAQLGVAGITPSAGLTPDVYREVVHSYQILADVARARYRLPGTTADSSTLIDYFGAEATVPAARVAAVVEALRQSVGASVAANTGLVTVRVTLEEPEIAFQVAQRILLQINEFNRQSRQEHARAERMFLEDRLREVEEDLRAAENGMQQFLEGNRNWENAPGPRFAHDRLQRELLMRQETYLGLSQSYEQTRLNEIRDTPAMTIIDAAVLPIRPDGRRLIVRAVLALLLGTMVGVILAFIRDRGQDLKNEGDEEFAAFQSLKSEALNDLAFWRRSRSTRAAAREGT